MLSDGENEFTLAPAVAANVFLAPTHEPATDADVMRLSDLENDARAEVVGARRRRARASAAGG